MSPWGSGFERFDRELGDEIGCLVRMQGRPRSVLGVEVVVHGEATDLEAVSDVLDRFAECESSECIEAADHVLLAGAIQAGDRGAELSFDLIDEAIECSLQTRGAEARDDDAIPTQRQIAVREVSGRNDLATEGECQRLDGLDELLHERQTSSLVSPPNAVSCHAFTTVRGYDHVSPGRAAFAVCLTPPFTMRRTFLSMLVLAIAVGSMQLTVGSQQSASDARAEREQVREEKAAAARELDSARADDEAVFAALTAITSSVNAYQAEIDEAERQLADAQTQVSDAQLAIIDAELAEAALLDELAALAVAGYVSGGDQPSALFESENISQAIRQDSLLEQANGDTTDLLEQLRVVQEDRDLAAIDAATALADAEALEIELAEVLVVLEDEQAIQAALKLELESRVADWESKVSDLAAADAELTQFIRDQEAAAAAAASGGSSAPAPGSSSVSGFQWPVNGSVTSGYGYRVHPIYGTRRLHQGLDISGGSGTPIAAAKGGTVISAGWRGGYGNAVVISHGDGVTTLYAHQSSMNVSSGQQVSRGDIVGWVGSTGASTGPHLHFEVRINGSAVNPRPYLP